MYHVRAAKNQKRVRLKKVCVHYHPLEISRTLQNIPEHSKAFYIIQEFLEMLLSIVDNSKPFCVDGATH